MPGPPASPPLAPGAVLPLRTIAREWGRIGCVGFGGPPAHIALLRELCVERRAWLRAAEFEDAIATTNLLPGPGSTQLAIFCAWRLGGVRGALVGGAGFILPGLIVILGLSALFLGGTPPDWVVGAGAGAGAAVAAVALQAGTGLLRPGWERSAGRFRARWIAYVATGAVGASLAGPWLVLVLLACGAIELGTRGMAAAPGARDAGGGERDGGDEVDDGQGLRGTGRRGGPGATAVHGWPVVWAASTVAAAGGLGALVWTAFKVGALSYGGGFVIIPLMQADAVDRHHWMTSTDFLSAVALGQVTPGPVVHTVAVVGFAVAGVGGGLLAAAVAFAPSFSFILIGAARFDRLRSSPRVRAFLDGAGPAAIGAILGSAVPLALALTEAWQAAVLAAAALALLVLRRGVVITLVAAGLAGALLGLAGAPLP